MPDKYGAPTLEELKAMITAPPKQEEQPYIPALPDTSKMSTEDIFRYAGIDTDARAKQAQAQAQAEQQRLEQERLAEETKPTGYLEQLIRGGKSQGASVFQGLAEYLKSQAGERPAFDESKVPVEKRASGLQSHAQRISDYMGGVTEANRPQKQYGPWDIVPFASDYWTNPRGAAYDIGGGVGSTLALAPVTAAIAATLPESVPVAVAGGAAKILQKLGMLGLAEKAVQKGGVNLAKWATTGALGKAPEAGSEGGNVAKELEKQGFSKDEIRAAANFTAMYNLPILMTEGAIELTGLTGLLGKVAEKPGTNVLKNIARNAAVNLPVQMTTEALTELKQEQISSQAKGEPYGQFFRPDTWLPGEIEAAAKGAVGSLGLGVPGSVVGGVRSRSAAKQQTEQPATQPVPTPAEAQHAEETGVTVPERMSGLDTFKRAVASVESQGQPDPYTAQNESTGAYGKYQFMPETWAGVMRMMGLPEDTPMTPDMQEKAADAHMTELYNKLGSWDKVAIAWQAGEQHGNATDEQLAGMGDRGLSTLDYRNKVMSNFNRHETIANYQVPVPKYNLGEGVNWDNVDDNTKTGIHVLLDAYNKQFPDDVLTITDTYRPPESAIGSPTSYHKAGEAADLSSDKLIAGTEDGKARREWLVNKAKELGFGEVLNEIDEPSQYATGPHFHVAHPTKEFNYSNPTPEQQKALKDRVQQIQSTLTDPEQIDEIDQALKSKSSLLSWAEKNNVTPDTTPESTKDLEEYAKKNAIVLKDAPDAHALKETIMPKVESEAQVNIKQNLETAKSELEKMKVPEDQAQAILADQEQKQAAQAAPVMDGSLFKNAMSRTFKQAKTENRDFTVAEISIPNKEQIVDPSVMDTLKAIISDSVGQSGAVDLQMFAMPDGSLRAIVPDAKAGVLDDAMRSAVAKMQGVHETPISIKYADYAGKKDVRAVNFALGKMAPTLISPITATETTIPKEAVKVQEAGTSAKKTTKKPKTKLSEQKMEGEKPKGSPGEFFALRNIYDFYNLQEVKYKDLTPGEQALVQMSHQIGLPLRFVTGEQSFNGMQIGGTSILNRNGFKGIEWAYWHEMLHWLKEDSPDLYWMVRKEVATNLAITPEQIQSYRDKLFTGNKREEDGTLSLSDEEIIEEIICDGMADYATRMKLATHLVETKPGIARQFFDFMKKMFEKLMNFIRGKRPPEKGQAAPWVGLTQEQTDAIEQGLHDILLTLTTEDGKYLFNRTPEQQEAHQQRIDAAIKEFDDRNKAFYERHGDFIRQQQELQRQELAAEGKPVEKEKRQPAEAAQPESEVSEEERFRQVMEAGKDQAKFSLIRIEPEQNVTMKGFATKTEANFFEKLLYSMRKLADKYPKVKVFVTLAEHAREVQEHWRDHFKHRIEKWEKVLKMGNYKENKENLHTLLWQGDEQQKEFTRQELQNMGYNESVIKAYTMVRSAIKKAYHIMNEARQKTKHYSRVLNATEVAALRNNRFVKINSTVDQGNGNFLVGYSKPKTWESRLVVSQAELTAMQNDPNIQIKTETPFQTTAPRAGTEKLARGTGFFTVEFEQQTPPIHELTGYIPHYFHQWFVMKEVSGQKVVVASAKTAREATLKGNEMAKANPNENYFIAPKQFEFPGAGQQAAVIGDYEYEEVMRKMSDDLAIPLAQARDLMSDKIVRRNRQRFVGNFLQRKGAAGFEENMDWVLKHYFNSAARYTAMNEFKGESISRFERIYGRFDEDHGGEAAFVKNYINDVNGVPTQIEKELNNWIEKHPDLRQFLGNYLGDRPVLQIASVLTRFGSVLKLNVLNVASSVMQLAQIINANALIGDERYTAKAMKHAFNPTQQDRFILARCNVDSNMNLEAGAGYSKTETMQKYLRYSTWTFQKMDMISRRTAVLGAYWKKMDEIKAQVSPQEFRQNHGMYREQAITYAKDINKRANFEYAVDNAPDIFRRTGPVGQVLLQFKKYPMMQIELMTETLINARKNPAQFARLWAPTIALAGYWGIPLVDVFGTILATAFGKDDWEKELKKAMFTFANENPSWKPLIETLNYGAISQLGMDVGKRVGVGEFGSIRLPKNFLEGLSGLFGVAGNTVYQIGQQISQDDPVGALKAFSPGMGNILQAAAGETIGKRGRTEHVYGGPMEKIFRGLGFTPIEETVERDVTGITKYATQQKREESTKLVDAYIKAKESGNKEKINKAIQDLQTARVPFSSVRAEEKKKNVPAEKRTIQETPKKYRNEFERFQSFGN